LQPVSESRLRHRLLMLFSGCVRLATKPALDEVPLFRRMRGALYARGMPACGRNFQVSSDAILWGLEHLHVGNDVYVGPRVTIICLERVEIGDGVLMAPHVVITNGNHVYRDGRYRVEENEAKPVSIGAGSWIGANVTILAGVRIGRGALVAANAVVTGDVPDYEIVGGVPAKSLGKRPAPASAA
jgi:maltose O-acetyltransferase